MKRYILFTLALLTAILLGSCKGAPVSRIKEVYAGTGHVFLLLNDGTLWAAGYNLYGQLGLGNYTGKDGGINSRAFVQVMEGGTDGAALKGIRGIAAGESHTLLLKDDGSLWAAGDNSFGALGLGQTDNPHVRVFTAVKTQAGEAVNGVTAIAAGADASFFIKNDGSLWAAGYNHYGNLGLQGDEIIPAFTRVTSAGNGVKAVAAGNRHTVILKNDGSVWTTGNNYFGQLGLGDSADRFAFTALSSAGTDNKALSAGNNHTVILKNNGSLWAAGGNYSGQLGLGDFAQRTGLTQAGLDKAGGSPMTGIRDIDANGDNTLVMKDDGSFWAAGDNFFSQLGEKNEEFEYARNVFIPLKTGDAAKKPADGMRFIAAGSRSLYIISQDGNLQAAGSNRYGQLNLGEDVDDAAAFQVIYP
ncbi:chromosome condensation protein RCC1 [Spirochaetia bacterium]|nr:chromosome condensation protein RCC1 [Spirochaetia bacterium]